MSLAKLILALSIPVAFSAPASAADRPPAIVLEADVAAPPEAVWNAWTTNEGAQGFLAPDTLIEPWIGGRYEIYFLPDRPLGLRGSETATILAMERSRRLMISWNAPEEFGLLREQLTVVELTMEPGRDNGTRLTLTHSNWGYGTKWGEVRAYFATVWPKVILRLTNKLDRSLAKRH